MTAEIMNRWQNMVEKCFPYLVVVCVLVIFYLLRMVFLQPYDAAYVQQFYDQSQWQIPQSTRVIGDNEYYQVAGYRLASGADPFSINPEVPPVSKYLYGFSQRLTGSPYWISPILFLGFLLVSYLLLGEVGVSKGWRWLGVLLLATSPIVVDQIQLTMLDLPMVVFLTGHVWLTIKLTKTKIDISFKPSKQWLIVVGAGVLLGGFAGSKIPFFVPGILIVDGIFLWRKQLRSLILMTGVTGLTYLAAYAIFFIQGHTLIEWLKNQKWMANFYVISGTPFVKLSNLIAVASGWYKDWWGLSQWHWTNYWSPVWILGFLAAIWCLFKVKSVSLKICAAMSLMLVAMQGLQPFWPRYFLIILPFVVVCLIWVLQDLIKKPIWIWVGLSILSIGYLGWFLRPGPADLISHLQEDWQQSDYVDVYNYFVQVPADRARFAQDLKQLDQISQTPGSTLVLSLPPVKPWQNQVLGQIVLTYPTPLGVSTTYHMVVAQRSGTQWRLIWPQGFPLDGYELHDAVSLSLKPEVDGSVKSVTGQTLSHQASTWEIWVQPNKLKNDNDFFEAAARATGKGAIVIREEVYVKALPDQPYNLGVVKYDVTPELLSQLKTWPGVNLKMVLTSDRNYSPGLSATQLTHLSQFEFNHPELRGKVSGELKITDQKGQIHVVQSMPAVTGKDLVISPTELGK